MVEKQVTYPWLIAKGGLLGCKYCKEAPIARVDRKSGSVPSEEWRSNQVGFSHGDSRPKKTKLAMLRKKIGLHLKSAAHISSTSLYKRRQVPSNTQELLSANFTKYQTVTEKIFRVAYNIAKMNRPYTDLPDHIDCYTQNGVNMSNLLHTDKACANIINSIASDMRTQLTKSVTDSDSKISLLIDESTTISNKTALVIHLRACINGKPTTFFLDLVHLVSADAKSIVDAVLKTLAAHGFDTNYMEEHFICFASDGASVMTGTKSGVGAILLGMFPDLVLWHCSNHRLELSVNDAIGEVSGINPFKIFLDSLYSLYNQSPKLQQELADCASSVDSELKKIGRVLDTRWSASSLRTVKAVWTSFQALETHFSSRAKGKDKDAAKFQGLLNTLTSENFITNLAVMYDALEEISHLSILLQRRDVSIPTAHRLIDQAIKAVEGMIDEPGSKHRCALEAAELGEFKGIQLSNARIVAVNPAQFYRSLGNSLRNRMLTVSSRKGESVTKALSNSTEYTDLLGQISLLDFNTWPINYGEIPSFGESQLHSLCKRFKVETRPVIEGFKLHKATGGRTLNAGLEAMKSVVECIPVSTAECERAFSVMNTIINAKRNRMDIGNAPTLMFINIVGPPITVFNPTPYVKEWLDRGNHAASDTKSVKRTAPDGSTSYYAHLYSIL